VKWNYSQTQRCEELQVQMDTVKILQSDSAQTFIILFTSAGKLEPSKVFCRHAISYRMQPRAQISDFWSYCLPSHSKIHGSNVSVHSLDKTSYFVFLQLSPNTLQWLVEMVTKNSVQEPTQTWTTINTEFQKHFTFY